MAVRIIDQKLKFKSVKKGLKPEYIVVHHALSKSCSVQDIHKWHLEFGWSGIGYHFFISKKGIIYKGREEYQIGAHCKEQSMNVKSLGICLEGCYENYRNQTDKEVPAIQLKSLVDLTKHLMAKYNIPLDRVKPHNYFASYKNCPGTYFPYDEFYKQLEGPKEHWAEKHYQSLKKKGINIYQQRYDDSITRGEVFALLDKIMK